MVCFNIDVVRFGMIKSVLTIVSPEDVRMVNKKRFSLWRCCYCKACACLRGQSS